MSKELKNSAGQKTAWWYTDGSGIQTQSYGVHITELPAFIAWLQEGPPKKEWTITRKFKDKPTGIVVSHPGGDYITLTDADVEDVAV